MISAHQALAMRRLMLTAGAMAATLGAHAAGGGGLHPVPAAPALWGAVAALAVLRAPRRPAAWRPRPAAAVVARLLALQAALHLAMTAAPWAFGLSVHHRAALLAPAALAAHGAAAVALGVLIARAERLISLMVRVARAVRRALAPPRRRAMRRTAAAPPRSRAPRGPSARAWNARGPPAADAFPASAI